MLFLLVLVAVPQVSSMRCGDARRVVPTQIRAAVATVKKDLTKKGLHITDLPSDGQTARRLVEAQMSAGAWCAADDQVRILRDSLTRTKVDSALVSAKVTRASGFARDVRGKTRIQVERKIARATVEMNAGHVAKANGIANDALFTATGSKDPWRLPVSRETAAVRAPDELSASEVEAGCPGVDGKSGRNVTLAAALDKLRATLEETSVRTVDIRRGPELMNELDADIRGRNTLAAVRVACVLAARARSVSDGLDRTMARFQRVNLLRDRRGVSDAERPRFDQLVNQASLEVAARNYAGARATLETLLVFLGDPVRVSGDIPGI